MSRLLAALLISSTILAPIAANAFGLPGLPGSSSSSDDSSGGDLPDSQGRLLHLFTSAGRNVLEGDAFMEDALGLSTEATRTRAAGDSLSDGSTKGNLSDADKATSDSNDLIAAKLKDTDHLDGPAKQKFANGMVSLAKGLIQYIKMKNAFSDFQKGISHASPTMLPKLQTGAYIVTAFPTNVKNLTGALNNAVAYAKSHDIKVPKDATDALSM